MGNDESCGNVGDSRTLSPSGGGLVSNNSCCSTECRGKPWMMKKIREDETDATKVGVEVEVEVEVALSEGNSKPSSSGEETNEYLVGTSSEGAGVESRNISNSNKRKLVHIGRDPVLCSDVSKKKSPDDLPGRSKNKIAAGNAPEYKLPYSSISAQDHGWYQERINRYHELPVEELCRMDEIHERAIMEASEREEFFRNIALQRQQRYYKHSSEALAVFNKLVDRQREACDRLPNSYRTHSTIPLDTLAASQMQEFLCHEKVVCRLGSIALLTHDNYKEYTKDNSVVPKAGENVRETSSIPIERDDVALALSKKHNADIIISSEALTALISGVPENMEANWEIPLTVVSGFLNCKRIIVGDPLMKCSLSVKEMLAKVSQISMQRRIQTNPKLQFVSEFELSDIDAGSEGEPCVEKASELHERLLQDSNNLCYSTWTFGEYRILARYSYLGLLSCDRGEKMKFAFCGSKLEYSMYENFEKYTVSEMIEWWSKLFIHPNSHLLLARVDATNEKLVRTERINRAIVDGFRGSSFDPKTGLDNFYQILNHIKGLPEGSFLLSREKGETKVKCLSGVSLKDTEVIGESCTPACDHLFHLNRDRGVLNKDIEFICPEWRAEKGRPQIPETFSPWLEAHDCGRYPSFFNKEKQICHCHAYLKGQKCVHEKCPWPHLNETELKSCDKLIDLVPKGKHGERKKFLTKIPYCFAYSAGQVCPFGGEETCPYPHLSQRVVRELSKLLCQKGKKT